jgi:hypothetical protein
MRTALAASVATLVCASVLPGLTACGGRTASELGGRPRQAPVDAVLPPEGSVSADGLRRPQPEICRDDGWCLVNPSLPSLTQVWGAQRDDLWGVASDAGLVHWNGALWMRESLPIPVPYVYAVFGTDGSDVWALANGDDATTHAFHRAAGAWTEPPLPAPMPDDAGAGRAIVIGGRAPNDVWLAGPVVAHWDGSSWRRVDPPVPHASVTSLAVRGANDVLLDVRLADGQYVTYRRDGAVWSPAATIAAVPYVPCTLAPAPYRYDSQSPDDAWTVTPDGDACHRVDGQVSIVPHPDFAWTAPWSHPFAPTETRGVTGNGRDTWLLYRDHAFFWTGSSWSLVGVEAPPIVPETAQTGDGSLWAIAAGTRTIPDGTLVRFDPAARTWSAGPLDGVDRDFRTPAQYGVLQVVNGDAWVNALDPKGVSHAFRRQADGHTWREVTGVASIVAATIADDAWGSAAGTTAQLAHFDGATWRATPLPPGVDAVVPILPTGRGEAWGFSGGGCQSVDRKALRYQAGAWKVARAFPELSNIFCNDAPTQVTEAATSGTDLYMSGWHFDGATWTRVADLSAPLWADKATGVWGTRTFSTPSSRSMLRRFDGRQWTDIPAATGFSRFFTGPDGYLWGASQSGRLYRRRP